MTSAIDVAKFFLTPLEDEDNECITNLKLQKLLYYAQGFSLAKLNRKIFNERILNWKHGPVVESVYQNYKSSGDKSIPMETTEFTIFSEEELAILFFVRKEYGQYSAWKLRNMTHEETPWLSTKQNEEITTESMKDFFSKMKKEHTFTYDLKRIKDRVEGEFFEIPASSLSSTEAFKNWLSKINS